MQRKHVEYFYDGAPEAFPIASAPGTPYGSQRYDAFGRAVQTFDLDGTLTLKTVYHALGTDLWDAADLSTGPHASTYASERKDGHGRTLRVTERAHSGNTVQARHVITEYSPTGQPEVLTRRLGSNAAKDVVRWMRYDSLGRMVLNVDPHTSTGDLAVPDPATAFADYERPDDLKAWSYLYNYAGDLVGTEDARGCGVNFGYDALGRLLGEDYVPCESTHQAYSAPNGDRTEGLEVVYYYDGPPPNGDQVPAELGTHRYNKGRLVTVRDRAAETTTFVDGRGRVISTVRRVGSPADANEVVDNKIANRYTAQWFYKRAAYDAADRVVAESVGGQLNNARTAFDGAAANVFGSDAQDKQVVRTHYTARGTIQGIDGSYGTLVRKLTRRADGLVTNLVYGDSAGTQTSTTYDDRRRPISIQTYRAGSPLWSAFATGGGGMQNVTYSPTPSLAGTSTTFQMLLEDTDLAYDEVGNPVEIRDWREASEWPASSKPVTKKIEYDDLYRVRRMDYLYSTAAGTDTWTSPFDKENTEADADREIRRAKPVPQLSFSKRPLWQRFEYDWLGNLSESDDDAHGIYDRSLGTQEHKNAGKPYQLTRGSNATQAASGGFSGNVTAVYDAAGNMTRLSVVRPNTTGACVPSGVGCTQYYAYNWDEVGRLVRAQRWDSTSQSQLATDPVPTATASFELRYRYDASDQRVIKRLYRSTISSQRQSLYLFGSLEVHRTAYSGSTYTIDDKTLVPYLMSNGVRLARLHYEAATTVTQVAGTGLTDALGKTNTAATLHVLLELGDHLGSTGTVLDKVSSELVEKTGYLPFGARENDYRPSRWNGFREDYGFTGKEEDVQVGLVYFGKRYLSPQLGRWLSPDPLAVHAPGRADFNLYAYVLGYLLKATDPLGLTCGVDEGCEVNKSTNEGATYNDGTSVTEAKSQVATQQYEASKQAPPSKTSLPESSPTVRPGSDSASAKPTYTPNFEALAGPLGAVGFALTYAGSSLAGASPQEAREAATRAAVDLAPVDGMLMGVAAARSQRADVNASCQAAPQGVVPERAQPTVAPRAEGQGKSRGGALTIVEGGSYSASETNAAQHMAALGNNVTLRPPVGTRAGGGTSDLLVNGARYDVYTPKTSNPDRIISAIAKKNTQAEGIVLDLSQTSVTSERLGNVLERVQGAGATNIRDIVIMGKK